MNLKKLFDMQGKLDEKILERFSHLRSAKEGNMNIKYGLYNDHFQNYKRYNIPKAQLVIADIPYNLGANA